ncbi:MAG: alpha/beta fold hydrolase [Ilumatobacteraceae bacterium]
MTVLHVQQYGDPVGPATLALHGVTAHGRRFERIATERWSHRRVVAPDLRGHGRSTWLPPWSIEQHVTDVIDTMDALELGTVDVVAHSYGGTIAMHLLAAVPARVRRLVLLDPALEADPEAMLPLARAAISFGGFGTVDDALRARNAGLGDDIHPDVRIDIEQHLVEVDGRYRYRFEPAAVVTGYGELCRPLPPRVEQRPTLLVAAMKAAFVTPAVRARLRDLFGAALETADLDSGHMLYWERFDETAALVTDFLDR